MDLRAPRVELEASLADQLSGLFTRREILAAGVGSMLQRGGAKDVVHMPITGIEILHRTTEPLLRAEMPWTRISSRAGRKAIWRPLEGL